MTSSKRIPKLSLNNLDPIEKDAYLSTYKLKSISKISTGFPDRSTAHVSDIIFGDSDEEISPKKPINNKYGSTQRPLLPPNTHIDIQNSKKKCIPPLPTYRLREVRDIDVSVDPNEFFENFEDHVKVHYIPDGRQSRMSGRISHRVSKDLSCELACEQERGAKNTSNSGRRQRNSSEETINLSKNLMWYLKQSNEKLQPLVNLDSGYSFDEELANQNGVRKSREMNPLPSGVCEPRSGVKNHLKERQNEGSDRAFVKENKDALNKKYYMQENRQQKKGQSVIMTNQSFENDYEQENDEGAMGKKQMENKENKASSRQVLRDITNYRQKDYKKPVKFFFDKENEQEKELNSSELYKKIKESQESSGLDNRTPAMSILESLKKKTEKLTNEMVRVQDTVLKDTMAFPGAPRHAESSNKKVGFFRERPADNLEYIKNTQTSKPKMMSKPKEGGERKSSKPKKVINQTIIVEDDVSEHIREWAKPKKRTSSISRL